MKIGQIIKAKRTWNAYFKKFDDEPCNFFITGKSTVNDSNDVMLYGCELDTFENVCAYETDCTLLDNVPSELKEAIESYTNCISLKREEIKKFDKMEKEHYQKLDSLRMQEKMYYDKINLMFGTDPNAPTKVVLRSCEKDNFAYVTFEFKDYTKKKLLDKYKSYLIEIEKELEYQRQCQKVIDNKAMNKFSNQDDVEKSKINSSKEINEFNYTCLFIIQEELRRRKIEFTEFPIEEPLCLIFDNSLPDDYKYMWR